MLEIGGCDTAELAREFGTPAYVYAEDDMRERARATQAAFAERTERFEVLYASKAFPCTAALRIFAEEGLSFDVASGGELHLALTARASTPRGSTCTATTRPTPSSKQAVAGRHRPRDRRLASTRSTGSSASPPGGSRRCWCG